MSRWGGRKVAALRELVYSTWPAVCRLFHQPIDTTLPATHPMGPSVGHVKPRSKGGTDDLANLRPEPLSCNVGLGARPVVGRKPRMTAAFFE